MKSILKPITGENLYDKTKEVDDKDIVVPTAYCGYIPPEPKNYRKLWSEMKESLLNRNERNIELEILSERDLVNATMGTIYAMAPNHMPRKADAIVSYVRSQFREIDEDRYATSSWHAIFIDPDKLYTFVEYMLKSCDDFNQLNITQYEYDSGYTNPEDENRPVKFGISNSDKEHDDAWRYDFIDLDACVRNIVNQIFDFIDKSNELCKYDNCHDKCANNTTECYKCTLNENFKNMFKRKEGTNYSGSKEFICKYDCANGNIICCADCDNKDVCAHVCKNILESDTCEKRVKVVRPVPRINIDDDI